MKKFIVLIAGLMILIPGFIKADIVTFKVGFFFPKAQSDLWDIQFENLDLTKTNYQTSTFAFSYEYFLSNEFSLVIGVDGYNKQKVGTYLDLVGEEIGNDDFAFDYGEGFPISQVFAVSNTPLQISLKIAPLGRRGKIIPYIGGGAGLYLWNVKIQGDMVDYTDTEIFYDSGLGEDVIGYGIYQIDAREENRLSFGFHGFGGVMIPIANRISIDLSVKMNMIKGNFKDAFEGFEKFDLSGFQAALGVNYWF